MSHFPKIPAYRGEADPLHLTGHVVCMEKIDGSNTRIVVPAGAASASDIRIGGRTLMEGEPGFSQDDIVAMIRGSAALCDRLLALSARLGAEVVLYGETCGAKIQKMGFIYGSRLHLLLFAARVDGAWVGLSRTMPPPPQHTALPTLSQLAEAVGLPVVPVLYAGPPDETVFDSLLKRTSQHSLDVGFSRPGIDNSHEGIVIWPDPVLLTPWGTPLVAKHKPAHRREYAAPHSPDASPEDFARRAVQAERIHHARQFLKESGRWTGQPEVDQAALVRRVLQDVSREVPEYPDQLRRNGKKAVRAALKDRARIVFAEMTASSD